MIEISMNDSFGRTIGLYSEKCEIGLEIGGGTGTYTVSVLEIT